MRNETFVIFYRQRPRGGRHLKGVSSSSKKSASYLCWMLGQVDTRASDDADDDDDDNDEDDEDGDDDNDDDVDDDDHAATADADDDDERKKGNPFNGRSLTTYYMTRFINEFTSLRDFEDCSIFSFPLFKMKLWWCHRGWPSSRINYKVLFRILLQPIFFLASPGDEQHQFCPDSWVPTEIVIVNRDTTKTNC